MPHPTSININELQARLAFWRAPGVGPKLFLECLTYFSGIETLLQNIKNLPANLASIAKEANFQKAEEDLRWLEKAEHHLILYEDGDYPKPLQSISSAPPFFFVKGDKVILQETQIAMVGSRNPSHYGKQSALYFSQELARAGFVVTSGLALGIDGICHQGALDAKGKTVAVLSVGLDDVYPKRHRILADSILAAQGALISEFGVGTKALAENFPRRNRLISGLSVGVVVVEAMLKSGSLITARYALEQGRDVFAIPGSIYQALSQGCHALLKQGALCVETPQDVLEEIPGFATKLVKPQIKSNLQKNLSEEEQNLLAVLHDVPQALEDLIMQLGWSAALLQSTMTQLTIKDLAQNTWHGYVRI